MEFNWNSSEKALFFSDQNHSGVVGLCEIYDTKAKAKKKRLCFRDSAEYLFWNLKDFFYSEILKTPPLFFFEIKKIVKEMRGVFKKQRGLKEDGTFFLSFLVFLQ